MDGRRTHRSCGEVIGEMDTVIFSSSNIFLMEYTTNIRYRNEYLMNVHIKYKSDSKQNGAAKCLSAGYQASFIDSLIGFVFLLYVAMAKKWACGHVVLHTIEWKNRRKKGTGNYGIYFGYWQWEQSSAYKYKQNIGCRSFILCATLPRRTLIAHLRLIFIELSFKIVIQIVINNMGVISNVEISDYHFTVQYSIW